jgi:anti-anti-sigma regulatory factor
MNHRVVELSGALVIELLGDIDLDSSPAARKVLLDTVERSRKVGIPFMLTEVAEPVRRVLALARLDRVLPIGARPIVAPPLEAE